MFSLFSSFRFTADRIRTNKQNIIINHFEKRKTFFCSFVTTGHYIIIVLLYTHTHTHFLAGTFLSPFLFSHFYIHTNNNNNMYVYSLISSHLSTGWLPRWMALQPSFPHQHRGGSGGVQTVDARQAWDGGGAHVVLVFPRPFLRLFF